MSQIIHTVTLQKPAFGQACNGCGTCCIEEVCELGLELGDDTNCKALIDNKDGSYACGLVADPYSYISTARRNYWKQLDEMADYPAGEQALKQYYIEVLGAGRGCDSADD